MSNAITNPQAIAAMRLLTLIKGAELEGKGLRRKGESCLSILRRELGHAGSRNKILALARLRLEQMR